MSPKDGKSQGDDPTMKGGSAGNPMREEKEIDGDLAQKVAAAKAQDDELSKIMKVNAELKKQLDGLKDTAARAQAELQNAKIRMDKEAGDLRKYAAEVVLMKLLPTIDNFQRAFKHLPDDLKAHEWVKGVSAIEQDLMKQVTDMGLKRMDVLGQPVDAHKHEVLMEGPGEKGKVIEVFEEGYELYGKALRPAKVKVGAGQ